jgi:hypothetical protein
MSLLLGTSSTSAYGPTPTIDGTIGSGQASSTTAVSTSTITTITTTLTNDIIVAIVCIEGTSVTSSGITNVTASGLTFAKYTTKFFASTAHAGYNILQEVWYATASSTFSGTITASTVLFDDATIVAFGVNGCNLSAPFDTGTNLPVHTTFASASTTKTVTGINTNSNNPLLIASWYTGINNALNTLDTGYSQIAYVQNNGAVKWMYNFVEYKGVSGTAQSSATHNGATTTSTDVWGCTVFAMTG